MSELFGNTQERRWYIVQTYSGYENKVKANLEQRIATMGMEDRIGSLELGKLADMVVLDKNLFDLELKYIAEAQVQLTVIGGKIVYQASK